MQVKLINAIAKLLSAAAIITKQSKLLYGSGSIRFVVSSAGSMRVMEVESGLFLDQPFCRTDTLV